MERIKKGDIVGRISYGKDILFIVDRIININDSKKIAILKGIITRIKADSPLEDLEIIDKRIITENVQKFEDRISFFINKFLGGSKEKRTKKLLYTGKILHLDGDRRYSEKSARYYRSLGLNAVVKNIEERKQPHMVKMMIQRFNPDILVITGHDGMIKNGTKFQDLYNYRNSAYFARAVKEARQLYNDKDLVIFAGACQSFYEVLIEAGANFASSPARILIDFLDPLIIAQTVATTEENKYIMINDIEKNLRDGIRGINGIGAIGKKKLISII